MRVARRTVALTLALAGAGCGRRPPTDSSRGPQQVLDALVQGEPAIRNCVLAVARGTGPGTWVGAAGVAEAQSGEAMTPSTPIYIASVTKLYTATAVMMLQERGALSLSDPMAKYLPSTLLRGIQTYQGHDYADEVTIEQLLSHRSGIADYYDERASDGKTVAELLREAPQRQWTADQAIARARDDMRANFAPGTRTSYSDTNYQLLGKVVEAVAHKPLHSILQDTLFRPLELQSTWLLGHARTAGTKAARPADVFHGQDNITASRANGAYWADGGIVSTADEMIAFLRALKGGRLVRPDTLARMHRWQRWRFPIRYGCGTMDFELPRPLGALFKIPPMWGHSGSTGSFLYYASDPDLYFAGTVDQTQARMTPFLLMGRVASLV